MAEGAENTAVGADGERLEGTMTFMTTPELDAVAAVAVVLRDCPAWIKLMLLLPA